MQTSDKNIAAHAKKNQQKTGFTPFQETMFHPAPVNFSAIQDGKKIILSWEFPAF